MAAGTADGLGPANRLAGLRLSSGVDLGHDRLCAASYSKRDYRSAPRPVNVWALGINLLFVMLHYVQTLVFYDGIAQDLPSWTAQFAVALMLIVILGMENQRRGLFFGRKVRFRRAFTDSLRRYQGYFFSFAVIYTFWFHPMIPTWGHLIGFIHVVLVMTQGSLMFLRAHLNTRWMFLLEILVLPHAFQVALNQGNDIWPMFFFGFAAIFLVTQMHGLGLNAGRARYSTARFCCLFSMSIWRCASHTMSTK